jgi:hypothetical protein
MLHIKLPESSVGQPQEASEFLEALNGNLEALREASLKFQQDLLDTTMDKQPVPQLQNKYQPGDYILYERPAAMHNDKLLPKYKGPYLVLSHEKNDVTVRDFIHGNIETFPVDKLKVFHGTEQEARQAAMLDNDQYELEVILAYRGDPEKRTSMEFEVKFMDGTIKWLPWTPDLFSTVVYETYCRSRPELSPLIYSEKEAVKRRAELNRKRITLVEPGDLVYVDIRYFGAQWYQELGLPDLEHSTYVVPFKYTQWCGKQQIKIYATCELFGEDHTLNHDFVVRYGSRKELKSYMTLVDIPMVLLFPALLDEKHRERLLKVYRNETV